MTFQLTTWDLGHTKNVYKWDPVQNDLIKPEYLKESNGKYSE